MQKYSETLFNQRASVFRSWRVPFNGITEKLIGRFFLCSTVVIQQHVESNYLIKKLEELAIKVLTHE